MKNKLLPFICKRLTTENIGPQKKISIRTVCIEQCFLNLFSRNERIITHKDLHGLKRQFQKKKEIKSSLKMFYSDESESNVYSNIILQGL